MLPLARRSALVARVSRVTAAHCLSSAWLLLAGLLATQTSLAAGPEEELQRQRERERVLREQLDTRPDVRLEAAPAEGATGRLPQNETPCFRIQQIRLIGDAAEQFQWALRAANPAHDPALGQCLGAGGLNLTMKRVQNAIIEKGFVTTRVLAEAQDLNSGILVLTLLPGRIGQIRFDAATSSRANAWNALPARPGDLLNLRDIEQGLENFKRVPTADADIRIAPASAQDAKPGESDVIIAWRQRFPARLSLSVDNSGSKTTGKYQGAVALSLDNPLSLNDLFYASFNHDLGGGESGSKGTKGHTLHYSVPFGYWQLAFTTSEYDYHQTVAGVNQNFSYRGESRNNELRLSRLVYRDAVRKTTLWSSLWTRSSDNFIDDTQIEQQHRRMAGWQAGVGHREFIGASTLDLGLSYRRGTGAHGALAAPEEAFGDGSARAKIILADAQLQVPFTVQDQRLRYIGAWRAQWNRTELVPQDRFTIGTRYSVRGFDGENILSGDRGWTLSNELGLALGNSGQEAYAGIDYGEVGGNAADYLVGRRLAGAVVGVRGGYRNLTYDWSWGTPLKKPDGFDTAHFTSAFTVALSF
ncbi:ShlB/FhaC/HecB family hemolysin secretion/activation protein [Pseudomonas sp. K1(2024)]|uniref:ShlB/FhaC/HecB family hemolysin secretion/activation protein n=2 Tax=Pseudomonas TaxID=286 RepID=A0AAI8KEH9_9PSED|nr:MULTISPECIES: ShlB/FhaC/HecB family hemolysin secretion/activation protein [Pseudomonas]AIZ34666.1 membrane protein [Pseudomonas parafulva]AXO90430.1 ShlB/FhaC/HecB family hemolysin secretion/activation protein [Pseudomonas parafulva]MDO7900783.1 ShlB/FhaC/HecB family hemolysin secretion/activation protein [Pseudomonas sp. K13]